jgi:hypothetical protein
LEESKQPTKDRPSSNHHKLQLKVPERKKGKINYYQHDGFFLVIDYKLQTSVE